MTNPTDQTNTTSRTPPRKLAIWVFLAVAVALTLAWRYYAGPNVSLNRATRHPAVGQTLPLLELQPLTGTTDGVSLESIRGKVALINYWGTWCGPCLQEFPRLAELWDRYRAKPEFLFLSVSSSGEWTENVEEVRDETEQFLKSRSVAMPTYIDADGASRQMLANLFGEQGFGYPTTVLVDRRGVIRGVWKGYNSGDERSMEQMLSKLLAQE